MFDLLVDGYIARTFGPIKAERYLFDLLKTNNSGLKQLSRTIPNPGGLGVTFIVEAVGTRHSPQPLMQDRSGRPLWLLDYSIAEMDTVVPQELWSPQNVVDYRQHVTQAELQMPIFFAQEHGHLGLSLDDAINGRCQTLRDGRMQAPLGGKATTHMRIKWPGYCEFRRQIQIRDETVAQNPITFAMFAHHIGRSVDAFIRSATPLLDSSRDASVECWRFEPRGVDPAKIRVIGAIHVSAGSWMPILQLNDRIV